jgi:Xaa-Pro aminopeptidase
LPDVLIYGDSRYASLRHEVPVPLPDPIAYIEKDADRYVFAGTLDVPRLTELGKKLGFEVIPFDDLGFAELLGAGNSLPEVLDQVVARACERLSVTEVATPRDFPVGTADALRKAGIEVLPAGKDFDSRRRAKNEVELAGVRRAERAAEAAFAAVVAALGSNTETTAEAMRDLARRTFVEHGALPHDLVVIAPGPAGADPHDQGHGPIEPGVPIVIDVFPRDIESGCWGDLTRTVCIGSPPEELVVWHRDVREAQLRAIEAVRPGISGGDLDGIAMECLAQKGHKTKLDSTDGSYPQEGFTHYLGHGLGLELHENPTLEAGGEVLVAGDIVTIEPGLYRSDFGGCRIEDVVLVTKSGYELLSVAPYDLQV